MEVDKRAANLVKCNACQKEVPRTEVRYMSLKMCCNVERLPLCRECWQKYAKKS